MWTAGRPAEHTHSVCMKPRCWKSCRMIKILCTGKVEKFFALLHEKRNNVFSDQ